jgi:Mlc titration factor MtfA (ptsG expression regulator)
MTFLHELAHAYQNVKLKLSHKSIRSAYRAAMKEGLYLQVPSRRDKSRKVKAYAATNHEEYFAELTEAYFGHNDWFPHNREELREYDPRGFKMIEEVWSAEAFK